MKMMNSQNYQELIKVIEHHHVPQPDMREDTPDAILKALWALAQGKQVSAVKAHSIEIRDLSIEEKQRLDDLIQTWINGEPLAYITGRQHFHGLELKAGSDALIPRQETELLANVVLEKLSKFEKESPLVVDLCTGSGNLAVVFKTYSPRAQVFGADLSAEAIDLARENAELLGLSEQITFWVGDLLQPFNNKTFLGNVDCICCNPPYISSPKVKTLSKQIAEFEPNMAFDGGPFGISILQKLMSESADYLSQGGWLVFEVGAGQGPSIAKMLGKNKKFANVETHSDEDGVVRVVAAQKGATQ